MNQGKQDEAGKASCKYSSVDGAQGESDCEVIGYEAAWFPLKQIEWRACADWIEFTVATDARTPTV